MANEKTCKIYLFYLVAQLVYVCVIIRCFFRHSGLLMLRSEWPRVSQSVLGESGEDNVPVRTKLRLEKYERTRLLMAGMILRAIHE